MGANPFRLVGGFFGRFFGNTISESAAYGIGGALTEPLKPPLQELANVTWASFAANGIGKPPDVYTLAEGVSQRQVEESDARTWAHQQGITDDGFTALVNIANTGPALGLAYRAWRRNDLTPAQFRTACKRQGIEDVWIDALVALKQEPLDPSTVANAVHRGIMRDPSLIVREPPTAAGKVEQVPPSSIDPVEEAAWSGIDHERLRVEVGTTGLPPGLIQMLELLNRGQVTVDDVQRAVSQSNLRNEYMDVVLALKRRLLTPHEYEEAALRGVMSADEADAGAALSGMEKADARLLFQIMGRPLNVHAITTGLARGGTYGGTYDDVPEPYRDAIRRSNIRPEYAVLDHANRYTYPSGFQIKGEAQAGRLSLAETKQILLEIGWSPKWADHFSAAWAGGTTAKGDPHVAKAQTQLWTTLHRTYLAEETDPATATATLGLLGVAPDAQPQVLALWDAERGLRRAQLSAAQIKKALKGGVTNPETGQPWTRADATARLLDLGYDQADVDTFLDE